jgi:hypothetical protein
MSTKTISINRASVLTLGGAVVAERLGFDHDEALTVGKAVAGLNAQAKGRRLGIFKPHEEKVKKARERKPEATFLVEVLGRTVPVVNTKDVIRAAIKSKPISPESVKRYLEDKFGDDLGRVQMAMQKLAKAYTPKELAVAAYPLYERFRPVIPSGANGWGAAGELDLGLIESLTVAECHQAVFSPDGKVMATFHQSQTVQLWRLPFRRPVWVMLAWALPCWGLAALVLRWVLKRCSRTGNSRVRCLPI